MTGRAIIELQNINCNMKGTNLIRIMGVTVGASVVVVALQMAALAIVLIRLTMIERERVDS